MTPQPADDGHYVGTRDELITKIRAALNARIVSDDYAQTLSDLVDIAGLARYGPGPTVIPVRKPSGASTT
jgi:hypothetical protein